jgi:hypothetical protein
MRKTTSLNAQWVPMTRIHPTVLTKVCVVRSIKDFAKPNSLALSAIVNFSDLAFGHQEI